MFSAYAAGRLIAQGEAHVAVVDADAVANLAAE
jgi:hypothetical protein